MLRMKQLPSNQCFFILRKSFRSAAARNFEKYVRATTCKRLEWLHYQLGFGIIAFSGCKEKEKAFSLDKEAVHCYWHEALRSGVTAVGSIGRKPCRRGAIATRKGYMADQYKAPKSNNEALY